ncbi:MarR family transcriptional regulator [Sphingomonas kaistensis]|jgi:hypothetical protein|uniref:MarR family transcriptional regulator n=1 Tax=Sphingomonas kaistensis TaxID=298708 RepID=A0ABZ2G177_9SPHN
MTSANATAVSDLQNGLTLNGSLHPEMFPPSPASNQKMVGLSQIRSIQKARRMREQIFGRDLFADPAWDILLEGFACHLEQRRLSIGRLSTAAAVPATTALRWIVNLEKNGWLAREDDPYDGRRSWVRLSEKALAAMRDYAAYIAPVHVV